MTAATDGTVIGYAQSSRDRRAESQLCSPSASCDGGDILMSDEEGESGEDPNDLVVYPKLVSGKLKKNIAKKHTQGIP